MFVRVEKDGYDVLLNVDYIKEVSAFEKNNGWYGKIKILTTDGVVYSLKYERHSELEDPLEEFLLLIGQTRRLH